MKRSLVALVFIAAFAVFTRGYMSPTAAFAMFLDNTYTFGPLFHYISSEIASGNLPLRIDTLTGGIPFYNSPLFSFYYPFYFLWEADLFSTPIATIRTMSDLTYAHVFVLSVNMTIFLRVTGLKREAAAFGALVFALSACIGTYLHALTIVASYAWLPLGVAAVHRIALEHGGIGWVAIGAASFALIGLATPSQSLIHAIMLAGIHAAACLYILLRGDWRAELLRVVTRLAIVGAIAFAVASPGLVTIALNTDEMRWLSSYGHMVGRGAVPYGAFLEDQSSIGDLWNVIIKVRANVAGDSFIGFALAALAVLGIISRWQSAFVKVYSVTAVYFLLSSTGDNLGLSHINHNIPLINLIRQPSRNLFLFIFAVAYLGAVGVDFLIERARGSMPWPQFASLAILVGAFAAWAVQQPRWPVKQLAWSDYTEYQNLRMHQALRLVASQPDFRQFRTRLIADEGQNQSEERMRFAMGALWYKVRTMNAWLSPFPSAKQFTELMDFGNRPAEFYRQYGVRYIVCTRCEAPIRDGLRLVGVAAGYSVYADDSVGPYIALKNAPGDTCLVIREAQSLNAITISAACQADAVLIVNEVASADWRGRRNGLRFEQSGPLLSVPLRPGGNIVEFQYAPAAYLRLLWLSAFGFIVLAALSLVALGAFRGKWKALRTRWVSGQS